MTNWYPLQKNDIVDIIAPASSAIYEIEKVKNFISSLGLVARIPLDLIDRNSFYLSNTDQYRINHLKNALYASDSKLIWCLRGGYGSMTLIPELDKLPPPVIPKAFIGFSDITALHLFLNQKWGWPTIHGRMIADLSANYDEQILEDFKNILFKQQELRYDLVPMNARAREKVAIKSQIIGGNLCLVENSLATSWQVNADNKILFLEEVGERPYRVDRSLEHLFQGRIFDKVKAVIFGNFSCENIEPDQMKYPLLRFIEKLDIPVFSIDYIGHNVLNPPLPLASDCVISLGDNPKLTCQIINS